MTILFWSPLSINKGDWPFIYFLKLEKGKIFANTDFGAAF
jgi:hypothetical protein